MNDESDRIPSTLTLPTESSYSSICIWPNPDWKIVSDAYRPHLIIKYESFLHNENCDILKWNNIRWSTFRFGGSTEKSKNLHIKKRTWKWWIFLHSYLSISTLNERILSLHLHPYSTNASPYPLSPKSWPKRNVQHWPDHEKKDINEMDYDVRCWIYLECGTITYVSSTQWADVMTWNFDTMKPEQNT